jgi:hypothetical protein
MRAKLRQGMTVHSADGHKLGTIVRLDADGFIIEKGLFFPKDYLCSYESVAAVDREDVRLAGDRSALESVAPVERDELADASGIGALDSPAGPTRAAEHQDEEDARMQAAEDRPDEVKKIT